MNNIWILTEEVPKIETIKKILELNYVFIENEPHSTKITPIMKDEIFLFIYKIEGITVSSIDNIFIKIVSGHSSFVDYLVFEKKEQPIESDKPLYIIEETKTDDLESRNTNAYQRSSKFVYCENFYDNTIPKYMLFDIDEGRKIKGFDTHVFGMRMLSTIGVNLKGVDSRNYPPFKNLEEFIDEKNKIAANGPKHNTPIEIRKTSDIEIEITAKLDKGNGLYKNKISNDPSIGAVSIISAVLRKLGWENKILLTNHNLESKNVNNPRVRGNKLLYIMKKLQVEFKDFNVNWDNITEKLSYWYYDKTSEKISSIFFHLMCEKNDSLEIIFNNHAGCGKSYFKQKNGELIPVDKETPLPDIVIHNKTTCEILVVEAEKSENIKKAHEQLEGFDIFIKKYIKPSYTCSEVTKAIITYGTCGEDSHIIFSLDTDGTILNNLSIEKGLCSD